MGHFQSKRGIKVRHFTATHILTGSFACLKCCTRRAYFEIPNTVSLVVDFFRWWVLISKTLGPSLNTQSCIKGLLGVRDFYFWVVWAAWPVQKKKVGGRL